MASNYESPSLSTVMGKLENNHKREKKIDGILPFLSYAEIKNLAFTDKQTLFDVLTSKFVTWPKFAKERSIDTYKYNHRKNPACILRCPALGGLCSCCGCHSDDYVIPHGDLEHTDVRIQGNITSDFNWVVYS